MTDIKPHVKVEQHPNPARRTYHVTREVTESDASHGFGDLYFAFREKQPSDLAKTLAERLKAIPGVISGRFNGYEISVGIGDAFDWKDIGPIVLGEIVNAIFPETLGGTIEISARIGWSYYVRPSGWDSDDEGHRTRYKDVVSREVFEVKDPQVLDVERLLDDNALRRAQGKVASEVIVEN